MEMWRYLIKRVKLWPITAIYIYTVFLFSSSIILPVFNEGQLYMNLVLALSELEDSLQLLDREYMENENTV